MNYTIEFHPETEFDIKDAHEWYENQSAGLGNKFLDAIEKTIERISITPLGYQKRDWEIRKALLRKFPYFVSFIVEDDRVLILSVMHSSRDLETGLDRLLGI